MTGGVHIQRVLVVHKTSFLQRHAKQPLWKGGISPRQRARLIQSDIENRLTLMELVGVLSHFVWSCDVVTRGDPLRPDRYDLVIAVGGDGTFFHVSHVLRRVPVLLVNSDPTNSLGLFSGATRRNVQEVLEEIVAGTIGRTVLNRMEVRVGSEKPCEPAVNDILFAHEDPAAMSRFVIEVDGVEEEQRGSGIWVSTAAGSTAAILTAGGRPMSISSQQLQVRAREPYTGGRAPYRFAKAFARREVKFTSLMDRAAIWIDGARLKYAVRYGEVVRLNTPGPSISILGYDDSRRKKLFF